MLGVADDTVLVVPYSASQTIQEKRPCEGTSISFKLLWLAGWRCLAGWLAAAWLAGCCLAGRCLAGWLAGWPLPITILNNTITILNNTITILNNTITIILLL